MELRGCHRASVRMVRQMLLDVPPHRADPVAWRPAKVPGANLEGCRRDGLFDSEAWAEQASPVVDGSVTLRWSRLDACGCGGQYPRGGQWQRPVQRTTLLIEITDADRLLPLRLHVESAFGAAYSQTTSAAGCSVVTFNWVIGTPRSLPHHRYRAPVPHPRRPQINLTVRETWSISKDD